MNRIEQTKRLLADGIRSDVEAIDRDLARAQEKLSAMIVAAAGLPRLPSCARAKAQELASMRSSLIEARDLAIKGLGSTAEPEGTLLGIFQSEAGPVPIHISVPEGTDGEEVVASIDAQMRPPQPPRRTP